ncbi:MAG: hypothetical protein Kow0027_14040 [Saprospiraceae bacterium]
MAELTILGFRHEALKKLGVQTFTGYEEIGNVLFVNTSQIQAIE